MSTEKLILLPRRGVRVLLATAVLAVGGAFGAVVSAQAATPIGAFTTTGAYSFVSAPNLHPPKIATDAPTSANQLAPGYFMVSNFKNLAMTAPLVGQGGPLILSRDLQPVWFTPVPTSVYALNLRTQTFQGKPALSWWEGVVSPVGAVASGEDVVVDQHYRQVATLTGTGGWILSVHEFLISGKDAWVTANRTIPMNLTAFGGAADGMLTDSAVQEYDLTTGKLVRNWDALAHIPLTESQTHPAPVPGIPWDPYHVNGIDLTGNGSFVTSMRNTWAGYMVNSRGQIVWTLGGNASTFRFGPNAQFEWQHNIELHPGGEVSLFDDACCGVLGPGAFAPPSGPSRGLVLKLNPIADTATLVAQYDAGHPGLETANQGDTQLLPNGNVLVGWGGQPWFSEYSRAGKLLLDARLPGPDISYRAYVQPWAGTPFFPPSGAARTANGKTTVYASWNGDTQVVAWRVLGGPNATHLKAVATRSKRGFETVISLSRAYKVFKLQALDAKGHVLRSSRAFSVPTA
jgi:Arylsulfotransferase (ASST)